MFISDVHSETTTAAENIWTSEFNVRSLHLSRKLAFKKLNKMLVEVT